MISDDWSLLAARAVLAMQKAHRDARWRSPVSLCFPFEASKRLLSSPKEEPDTMAAVAIPGELNTHPRQTLGWMALAPKFAQLVASAP